MNRVVRVPIAVVASVLWAGLALAQGPPPATAGAPVQSGALPGAPQGAGRGGFVPVPVVAPMDAGNTATSTIARQLRTMERLLRTFIVLS
jgi:hypothetical protein